MEVMGEEHEPRRWGSGSIQHAQHVADQHYVPGVLTVLLSHG